MPPAHPSRREHLTTLRFALLGTGYWAAHTHAPAIQAHPQARLHAVWGRDIGKARAIADRYGVAGYDDLDAAIEGADAIAVALPPDVQAQLAVRAAESGKHLLLDKPLALDVAAADAVVAATERAGVASVVFFTRRFVPALQRFLDEQQECYAGRVVRFGDIFAPGSPYRDSPWRQEYGGLWDVGPHALSLLLPVLGPVAAVTAMAGPYHTTYAILRHTGGAVSTVTSSIHTPVTRHECVFTGPAGEATAPFLSYQATDALAEAIGQLATLVEQGRTDHPCDVRFGREVVAVLAAVQRARDEGTVQRLV